jgi:hypothetical protein
MPQYMRAESKAVVELGDHEGVYVGKGTFNSTAVRTGERASCCALWCIRANLIASLLR